MRFAHAQNQNPPGGWLLKLADENANAIVDLLFRF